MKENCCFYSKAYKNNCSILTSYDSCSNCKFFLTKEQYLSKLEKLPSTNKGKVVSKVI